MRLILLKDVKGAGRGGTVIEASDGYARNFLLPRGLAKTADATSLNSLAVSKEKKEQAKIRQQKLAESLARKLTGQVYEFSLPADEKGHLYAGLKESIILAKIQSSGLELPEKIKLVDYAPIKTRGTFTVKADTGGGQIINLNILVK